MLVPDLSHAVPFARHLFHAGRTAYALSRAFLAFPVLGEASDGGRLIQVSIRQMPRDRWRELHQAAAARDMSIATFITRLLDVHRLAREYADRDAPTPGRLRLRAELDSLGMGTVRR